MKRIPFWLAVFLATSLSAASFTDSFSSSSPLAAKWFTQGAWSVRKGALTVAEPRRGWASPADFPAAREVRISARLRPDAPVGRDWKQAGLAIWMDAKNYWLFSLTEFPSGSGSKHLIELNEMLDGVWQARNAEGTRLPPVEGVQSDTWRSGEWYEVELELAKDSIRAKLVDSSGRTVYDKRQPFAAGVRHVEGGVPLLWAAQYAAAFDDVKVSARSTMDVPGRVNARRPIPAPKVPGGKGWSVAATFEGTGEEAALQSPWFGSTRCFETKGGALRASERGQAFATVEGAPVGSRVRVEADVTVDASVGGSWKQAGLAIVHAPREYWLLCLTEEPGNHAGAKHMVETSEMLAPNRWQAQNRDGGTKLAAPESRTFAVWTKGVTYRMRLEMTGAEVEGTVFGPHGEVVHHSRYLLERGREALRLGTPVLWCQGFSVRYDNVTMVVEDPTGEVPYTQNRPKEGPIAAYRPRPYTAEPMGPRLLERPTGFFGVAKDSNGVSWFTDPNGFAYFSIGVEQVKFSGHFSPRLGYSPYNRAVREKYGTPMKWAESAAARLRSWGFNTASVMPYSISPGGEEAFLDGVAVTLIANIGQGFVSYSDLSPVSINGFPNVFHPRWQEFCDASAREFCAKFRDNPWILGYYIDNELDWHGSACAAYFIHTKGDGPAEYGLVMDILNKPTDHSAHRALLDFLRKRYGTIGRLNAKWGIRAGSFEEIESEDVFTLAEPPPGARQDMEDFLRIIAERYYSATTSAIRKADPNHLVLGTRFAGWSQKPVWEMCGKYCDVVSVNHYPFVELEEGTVETARKMLYDVVKLCKKPILLSEWSFVSLESGLPCKHGAGERFDTEEQRSRAFKIYQSLMLETPFCVGSDYFMWADQPVGGMASVSNPEDCSYGLVKENDEPHPEITKAASEINSLAVKLHSQIVPVLSFKGDRLQIEDSCKLARDGTVEIWSNGRQRLLPVSLGTGRPLSLDVRKGTDRREALLVAARIRIKGLESTDRQSAWTTKVFYPDDAAKTTLVVANGAPMPVENYLLVRALSKGGRSELVGHADGKCPVQQLESGADGALTLAAVIPELGAFTAKAFDLRPSPSAYVLVPGPLKFPFVYSNDVLTVRKNGGSGDLLDRISIGSVDLGALHPLLWLRNPGHQFIKPSRLTEAIGVVGPARAVMDFTFENPPPAATAFRTWYRVEVQKGTPFLTSRFRGIENLASSTWTLDRYYHYMPSFIGGDKSGDVPENGAIVTEYYNPTLRWSDEKTGWCYGAVRPRVFFGSAFTIDENGNQHPDLCRLIRTQFEPGGKWMSESEEGIVIYGCKAGPDRAWEQIAKDVSNRKKVQVLTNRVPELTR